MSVETLKPLQTSYRPSEAIAVTLNQKTLIMLVGPAGIGKSTIMNEMVKQTDDFARVSGFTTRSPRPNDETGVYRYLSLEEAENLIHNQQVVQFAVHPTTDTVYGSEPHDYPADYNLLDTLSGAVNSLRQLPFHGISTISLTAASHTWRDWFLSRYPEPGVERTKRLLEAKQSIDWSLGQTTHHHWLLNKQDDQIKVAERAIAIARGETDGARGAQNYPNHLMSVIDELLLTNATER